MDSLISLIHAMWPAQPASLRRRLTVSWDLCLLIHLNKSGIQHEPRTAEEGLLLEPVVVEPEPDPLPWQKVVRTQ